jgi:hypothetical protein
LGLASYYIVSSRMRDNVELDFITNIETIKSA